MVYLETMERRRLLSAGMLDPSFGDGGTVTTDLEASFESSCGLALRDDGRILLGGTAYQDFAALRYTSSGRLDSTFGAAGVARLSLPGTDVARAMLVQPDGKILIAGRSSAGAAVARFNADGSLDMSFGDGGKVILTGTMAAANAIALQGTNILLAGELGDAAMIWRLTQAGAVDGSFGTHGRAAVSGLDDPAARALAVDSSGRILMTGTATNPVTDTDYLLVRFTEGGQLDNTFDGDGIVMVDIGVNCNEAYTIDLLDDGRMVLAGDTCAGASIAIVQENGALDTSFGSLGGLRDVFGTGGGGIADVAIDENGKIIVAGVSALDAGEFILARLNTDGSADETFGNAGIVVTQFSGWRGKAAALTIQPNGRILAAGAANSMFAMARYIADAADTDVMPPSAVASVSGILTAGTTEHRFAVAYSPDVDAATLGDGDILITGPGGFQRPATLIGIEGTTATYVIAPATGPWTGSHSGTYTLTLQDDQVADTTGNVARSAALGTFAVDIPISAPAGLASILGTPGSDVIQLAMNGPELLVTINGSTSRYIAATVQRIEIRGDSGHDTVMVSPGVIACWIDGGAGNDTIYGGAGSDILYGGADNDRIHGGIGHDRLYGQDGDDLLDGGGGNDLISGGAGRDTASYSTRRAAVRISLDNKANDGQAREKDNVRSDVEDITGGLGNDLIIGSRLNNILRGGRGNDTLVGNGGKDRLLGGPGRNVLQ